MIRKFRDLVEKVAVWYEIKYLDCNVVRAISSLPTDASYFNIIESKKY